MPGYEPTIYHQYLLDNPERAMRIDPQGYQLVLAAMRGRTTEGHTPGDSAVNLNDYMSGTSVDTARAIVAAAPNLGGFNFFAPGIPGSSGFTPGTPLPGLGGFGGGTGGGGFDLGGTLGNLGNQVLQGAVSGDCLRALREGRVADYLKCIIPGGSTGTTSSGTQNRDPWKEGGRDLGNILLPGQPFGQGPGEVVQGAFGIPGRVPRVCDMQVRVCGPGFVLGKDGICYVKGTVPRKFRAHKPARRPPVTAGDAKAIRRAAATKERVKELSKRVGLKMSSRSSSRRNGKRR